MDGIVSIFRVVAHLASPRRFLHLSPVGPSCEMRGQIYGQHMLTPASCDAYLTQSSFRTRCFLNSSPPPETSSFTQSNYSALHSTPVYLNELNSAMLRMLSGDESLSIRTVMHPFPGTVLMLS